MITITVEKDDLTKTAKITDSTGHICKASYDEFKVGSFTTPSPSKQYKFNSVSSYVDALKKLYEYKGEIVEVVYKNNKLDISAIQKTLETDHPLHVFWHGGEPNRLIKLAFKSWAIFGHKINVWHVGDIVDFGVDVNYIDLRNHVDEIPFKHMYNQKEPFGDRRTLLGFVDWCRFKIMEIMGECTIMDCDVILFKPFEPKKTTLVCEESFRIENKLFGYYPCAGILHTNGNHFNDLSDKALEILSNDGIKHGSVMNIIYQRCVDEYRNEFANPKDFDIIDYHGFFEWGYDDLYLFYQKPTQDSIKRLRGAYGMHCWNSMLDLDLAFGKDTLLRRIEIMLNNDRKPIYEMIRLCGIGV